MTGEALRARIAALPREFHIVAACCRPSQREDASVIAAAAAGGFDARALLEMARAHRVEGFVEDGLRRAAVALDVEVAATLAERAQRSRAQMLRNAGEEVRLADALAASGIDAVFVKGATLAMLAHGTLALKSSWDIDLLVPDGQIARARGALGSAGYRPQLPEGWDPSLFERLMASSKETNWRSPDRSVNLELHRALVDVPSLLPEVPASPPVQNVALTREGAVATLATPALLAYLAVHGTSHRWARLKWLCDFAALAGRHGGLDALAELMSPGVDVAVWLCVHVLGMPVDLRRIERIGRSRARLRLVALALDGLARDGHDGAPTTQALIRDVMAKYLQATTVSQKVAVLFEQLSSAYGPERLRVPLALRPAHALLWYPWRLATRRRRLAQASGGKTPTTP